MIVTFYSYKGGVGRSMALANVACQLANLHGFKVLVIDWDLEAPGLHFYFDLKDSHLIRRKGLVDMLWRAETWGDNILRPYLTKPSAAVRKQIRFGEIEILPCGQLDRDYMERVANFDWRYFYDNKTGFDAVEQLREQINAQYDICLIDARAGQTDSNVPPTTQLADVLVLLFTSSTQSISGVNLLCRRFTEARERGPDPRKVPIILVPSRVFPAERSYSRWVQTVAEPIYRQLLSDGVLSERDQPHGLEHVVLPIEQAYSAGEQLPVLQQASQGVSGLVSGYENLVALLLDIKNNDDLLWRPDRLANSGSIDESVAGRLRAQMRQAAERGDEAAAATTRIRLARYLREFHRYTEAESLALSTLTYARNKKDLYLQPLALHTLGQIAFSRGDFVEAKTNYEEALSLMKGADSRQAVLLHDLAVAIHRSGNRDEAYAILLESISIRKQLGDQKGLALGEHQLGNFALSKNDWEEASKHFQQAIELALLSHDELGAAISMHQLGNVRAKQGEFASALPFFREAMMIHKTRKNLRGSAITLRRIGDMFANLDNPEDALESYNDALRAAHEEGDQRSAQALHRRIGEMFVRSGRTADAREQLMAALRGAEEISLKEDAVRAAIALAELEIGENRIDQAQELLRRVKAHTETMRPGTLLSSYRKLASELNRH